MILDKRSLLSDKQAVLADAVSTNVYDLLDTGTTRDGIKLQRNMGKGCVIPFLVQIVEDYSVPDPADTLTITFQTSDTENFAVAKNVYAITMLLSDLKAGFILPVDKLPRGLMQRYFRMDYNLTLVGAAPTTGAITAGVVAAVDGSYQG